MNKNYETESRERWGNTNAYREHEKKTKKYTKEKWAELNGGLMGIFAEFAECKNNGFAANSLEVKSLVVELRDYITQNYYTCTNEILAGLGQMYVADERFKQNIDKYGEGTAEFVAEAIDEYFKPSVAREDSVLEKYWGDRKYKQLQCCLKKQYFSNAEKSLMSAEIIKYIREKGYTIYHDLMDDISESHMDWFNMLTFDKNHNKAVLMYIKGMAQRR